VTSLGGAILAAGEGTRFRAAGWSAPKPLIPVAGVPLIEHTIRHFLAAGVTSIVLIVNEESRRVATWAKARFPSIALECLVKTTRSSFESFQALMTHAAGARTLVSTVDAWCPDQDFARFVTVAEAYPLETTVLALTPFVDDERPLWARVDETGRVTELGGASGDLVTAGIYLVPARVRRLAAVATASRLREFLAGLVASGEPVHGVVLPTVVDVDRPEDVAFAEALASRIIIAPATRAPGSLG
jgi:NDP-sugar pyrophosphorylase family protein